MAFSRSSIGKIIVLITVSSTEARLLASLCSHTLSLQNAVRNYKLQHSLFRSICE